ncbi:Ig-like domain-containing protein [Luminiphilus sp.]|nr:Ig-like domain-containing protein [Luminiphilus sp.]
MRLGSSAKLRGLNALLPLAALLAVHQAFGADVTPPKLESWDQYPSEINVTDGPAKVYVEFRVTDDESGIETPVISASSNTTSQNSGFGSVSVLSSSNGGLNILYKGEIVIAQGSAPGPWEINLFPLEDKQGNDEDFFGPNGYNSTFTVVEDTPDQQSTLVVTLEEPAVGLVHMGVGNLRGWAVSSVGIRKVEAFLDGEFYTEIPYGGARGDVGAAFPDIDDSDSSGFGMSLNYSALSAGTHTLEVVAHGIDNKMTSSTAQFETVRFDSAFIRAGEVIDLNAAASVLSGDQIRVENISIAGKTYNLLLSWRTAEQGFEIVEITPLD